MRHFTRLKEHPDYGLDKCEHCGHMQDSDFIFNANGNIIQDNVGKFIWDIVCRKCGMTSDKE